MRARAGGVCVDDLSIKIKRASDLTTSRGRQRSHDKPHGLNNRNLGHVGVKVLFNVNLLPVKSDAPRTLFLTSHRACRPFLYRLPSCAYLHVLAGEGGSL